MARKQGKPYVITPHGMLYPDALHRSYWKKWPMIQLFLKKDIMNASCLHVTCKQEMQFLNTHQCGWWIDRKPENIAEVMTQVLDMPQEELDAMGERGKVLVREKFASDKVAKQMMALYDWLLHRDSPKPDFVYEI